MLSLVPKYRFSAVPRVYVSKDVESWFHKPDLFKKSRAADTEIEMVSGRTVCDQNVGLEWDSVLPRCLIALILEPGSFS